MILTIVTPTYNRANLLPRLYRSLIEQTDKDFIWQIIDDGSNDNTSKVIQKFIDEKKIKILYQYKENSGKHKSLNMAFKKICTDLILIVDSDDWLKNNAVQEIKNIHDKYKDDDGICGYSFLKIFSNGKVNGKILNKNEVIDDYINVRINGKDTNADKAEVWKTKYLKQYPFPEFENEKFIGEDIIWMQLSLKYKMVFLNTPIYIADYLDSGLTKNRRKNNILSPNGCFLRAKVTLDISKTRKIEFRYFLKCMLQYIIYGNFANKNKIDMFKGCKSKCFYIISFPLANIIYLKWKKEFENK